MLEQMAYSLTSDKPFADVVANIENQTAEHKFRVLAVHDVQKTLEEKGLTHGPLKIIEVCNATFAHEALSKHIGVAMFMPCKYSVYEQDGKTVVTLGRPMMISQMMPDAGLEDLAGRAEATLKSIMEKSV